MKETGPLNISHATWTRIDALSATGLALSLTRELMEKRGRKVNLGLSRRAWSNIELFSIGFALLFAVRNIYEAVEEYEGTYGVGSFFNPNTVAPTSPRKYNEF